jgi:hypothetical protein
MLLSTWSIRLCSSHRCPFRGPSAPGIKTDIIETELPATEHLVEQPHSEYLSLPQKDSVTETETAEIDNNPPAATQRSHKITQVSIMSTPPAAEPPKVLLLSLPMASLPKPKHIRASGSDIFPPSGASPSKRLKICNTTPRQYTKHPVHWPLDGNMIVQVEDVRSKLHRSRSEKHSRWFRDLFENPQAEGGMVSEAAEGRNVEQAIYLDKAGVIAKDFEFLLDMLDNVAYIAVSPLPTGGSPSCFQQLFSFKSSIQNRQLCCPHL